MNYNDILQWFEKNPKARPNDLTEDISIFIRATRSGNLSTPADFLAKFYIIHLKNQSKPLPSRPSDYNMEFVEKASDFFDYVSMRCMYNDLKKEGMLTYEDLAVGLIESDISVELKAEPTEKGTKVFEEFQKKLEEVYKQNSLDKESADKDEKNVPEENNDEAKK